MKIKMNPNLQALFDSVKTTGKKNFIILHDTSKTFAKLPKGKDYKIVCQSLKFSKKEILELSDKQAELLEQILKLRKVTKKLKAYEANFKTIDKNNN
jgi:hypothetical protein